MGFYYLGGLRAAGASRRSSTATVLSFTTCVDSVAAFFAFTRYVGRDEFASGSSASLLSSAGTLSGELKSALPMASRELRCSGRGRLFRKARAERVARRGGTGPVRRD